MPQAAHTLTLLPRQTRLINAAEGMQLEVHSGCLWLTRPGDPDDHFLVAGARMALHQNLVLIQSDRHPGARGQESACYRLTPLSAGSAPLLRDTYQLTQTQTNSAGAMKKGRRPTDSVAAVHACWAMAVRESWNPEM
jgi:hypothetical protein